MKTCTSCQQVGTKVELVMTAVSKELLPNKADFGVSISIIKPSDAMDKAVQEQIFDMVLKRRRFMNKETKLQEDVKADWTL